MGNGLSLNWENFIELGSKRLTNPVQEMEVPLETNISVWNGFQNFLLREEFKNKSSKYKEMDASKILHKTYNYVS